MKMFINRNFSILLSGRIVSQIGNNLYTIGLPWFVYSVTGSKKMLALAGFLQVLPQVTGLFTGVIVDRSRKRTVMMMSDVTRAVLSALLFYAAWHRMPIGYVIGLVLCLEFCGQFFGPASSAFLPLVVREEDLASASGVSQSATGISQLVGTLSGGPLIQAVGAPILFLSNAISFVVSFFTLCLVRVKEPLPARAAGEPMVKAWVEGIRFSFQSRQVALILIAAMATNFGFAPFDIMITAWAKGPLHGTSTTLSLLGASFFVGILVGGLFLGWFNKRLHIKVILTGGLVLDGLLVGGFGLVANVVWGIVILLLAGVATSLMNGSLGTYAYHIIPADIRGRVFGAMSSLSTLMAPVGLALFGALMVHEKLSMLFGLVGVPSVLSGLLLLLPTGRVTQTADSEPTSPPLA